MNNNYNKYIRSPINSYNYHKKSPDEMQNIINNMNFESAQKSITDFAFQGFGAGNQGFATNGQGFGARNQDFATNGQGYATRNQGFRQNSKLNTPSFLKGIALGLAVGFVATNPTIQKAVIDGAVKVWSGIQGNIEEIKEQIEDAKAEASAEDSYQE